jgi:putative DNA methylase
MAIVAERKGGRFYLDPSDDQIVVAQAAKPTWVPDTRLPDKHRSISAQVWGLDEHGKLFTSRQLVALTTFCDLVGEARERVRVDTHAAGLPRDGAGINDRGTDAMAYADAVATYLAFGLDKNTLTNCTLATWQTNPDRLTQAFSRQTLPMTWDYAEANVSAAMRNCA